MCPRYNKLLTFIFIFLLALLGGKTAFAQDDILDQIEAELQAEEEKKKAAEKASKNEEKYKANYEASTRKGEAYLRSKKYDEANDTLYSNFAVLTVAFLSALSTIIIYSSTHADEINVGKLILPLVGLSFAGLGWYMPKFKQNYFVGFKLPWTLENETNWNETHKVAGKLWLYGGLFQAVVTLILPMKFGMIGFMLAIAVMVIIPSVFSYRLFKKGNTI